MTEESIIKETIKLLKCDTARISKPMTTYFLIIGFNRDTKDNKSTYWTNNIDGKRKDFKYVEEKCVAMGKTLEDLFASVKEYDRLSKLSMEEYLLELTNKK